ncbi:MAG: transcriptional regulator [Schlesneria sp.]|jgi:nitrogen regulatory protein P-II 2|nr:transcriptional regulator [Schlesneria sp.]
MQLHTLKKVTIVTEDSLKNELKRKICELGASGFTCREVQGYGSRGARSDAFASNVEFEVICPEAVAHAILTFVSHHYFEQYACIAWLSDVQVVRGARYAEPVGTTP